MDAHPDVVRGSGSFPLGDGRVLQLRRIRPEDNEALVEFHSHLSEETVFLRYFSPHPRLAPAEVAHLTNVDGRDRFALVAELGGRLVAVGRYDRLPASSEAEVAFVVADQIQHRGVGPLLLRRLADQARSVGITQFTAEVLVHNVGMLAVFFGSGLPRESKTEQGTVHVRLTLDAAVASPAERDT
jgi:GNAT superfamily N-acetyltransferase